MGLNFPKLPLPDVEETIAFRAVDSLLRGDPMLQRVTKSYNSFTGASDDVFGPSPSSCPYLQLAPKPMASRWETEGMHGMPFAIVISAAVNGSNVDQLMNYWGWIRRALWPADPERIEARNELIARTKIVRPTLTMQGYGSQLQKDGGRILVGIGTLNLLLLIDTP